MKIASIAAVTAVVFSLGSTQVHAEMDKDVVAGALLLLGAAALAHNEHHYQEGWKPNGPNETADFDRGYRDGLHNSDYNARQSPRAYGEGFSAGMKERENRLSHNTRSQSEGPNVPPIAMQGCAKIVATNFGVGMHDVQIVKTVQRGPSDFLVEAAVGHKHMTCVMNASATPVEVYGGRIQ